MKQKNLIQYLDAQTITDEMPGMFNLPLHPRPNWSYKWLRRKASLAQLDTIQLSIQALNHLYLKQEALSNANLDTTRLISELNDGFAVDKYRSLHRYFTLNYIIEKRRSEINKTVCTDCNTWLEKAKTVRSRSEEPRLNSSHT